MALDWHTEMLRISLFTSETLKLTDEDWKAVTGAEEAETRTNIPGGRALIGPFLSGQLTLSSVGNRIDCVLTPEPSDMPPDERGVPSVGNWSEVSRTFINATKTWVSEVAAPVARIAFGTVLLLQVNDRAHAYERLNSLLVSLNVDKGMRDILFRVNHRTNSKVVPDLYINRLSTWTALKLSYATLVLTGAPQKVDMAPTAQLVRLELDHNTSPDWGGIFDPVQRVAIYEELVALADENATKGEVR